MQVICEDNYMQLISTCIQRTYGLPLGKMALTITYM